MLGAAYLGVGQLAGLFLATQVKDIAKTQASQALKLFFIEVAQCRCSKKDTVLDPTPIGGLVPSKLTDIELTAKTRHIALRHADIDHVRTFRTQMKPCKTTRGSHRAFRGLLGYNAVYIARRQARQQWILPVQQGF